MGSCELKFNKKFESWINEGIKIQTTRDHLKPCINDGKIVTGIFVDGTNVKGFCSLKILSVKSKPFKDLTSYDAIFEGYRSVEELKSNLLSIYNNLEDDDTVYLIRFKMIKEEYSENEK